MLGRSGCCSDTGATSMDFRTIRQAGPPFHYPTNLALAPDGSLYIADGYGNARVHRFSPDGRHLASWGEPGGGPGEFRVPHGIAVGPTARSPWPTARTAASSSSARRASSSRNGPTSRGPARSSSTRAAACTSRSWASARDVAGDDGADPGRDRGAGQRLRPRRPAARPLGRRIEPVCPRRLLAPHDLCLDSRGDLYVGEVTWSAGGRRGDVPADCHSLQKFARVP